MILKLYNTLTHSLQDFVPIDEHNVRIYSCGPTVYGEPHLGNMRKYFIDDLLKNVIKHVLGYHTTHVVNITDVWHLTGENEGDADHGEDKMEKWARRDGITARDVAKKYEQLFHLICEQMKLDKFDITPRATDHIQEQIDMIVDLEKKWFTYEIPWDGIYMDTSLVKDYACLVWQKHIDGLQSGARVDNAWRKHPTDFALWKFNMSWQKRDMERESPWWVWFPGRHIECSAMSIKYLGTHFDIHTGGIDHIPVHHTNEIAQSQCSIAPSPWVNYRIHYQFLNIMGERIAKSVGNTISVQEVLDRGYTAYDLRYFYLQAHYKSFQDFTREALGAAKSSRSNLKKKVQVMVEKQEFDMIIPSFKEFTLSIWSSIVVRERRITADWLLNDLNTPELLANIYTLINEFSKSNNPSWLLTKDLKVLLYLDDYILKLWLFEPDESQIEIDIPSEIQELADLRRQAKLTKDRAKADDLRAKLLEMGRNMEDWKDWYSLEKTNKS